MLGWKILPLLFIFFSVTLAVKYNVPLVPGDTTSRPVSTHEQDENTLMFVAFSGGGTRAAAMSWRTLEVLKEIPYKYQKEDGSTVTSTLADQIDYLSGISGGSFAATGWCLYRDSMDLFRERFVEKNIQASLGLNIFFPPWNGLHLFSPYFDRINIAANYYNKNVYDKKTFGDLPTHPVLWVNTTHLALGKRFSYTDEYFKLLSSDVNKYPLGFACAASSAFPILLSPMTLRNFGETQPDSVLMLDRTYRMAKRNSRRDIEKDFYCRVREFYNNKTNKWMHFSDGGLVDNQGLQAIIEAFGTNGIINKKLNNSKKPLKRLIILNVNAGKGIGDKSCEKRNAPKIAAVVNYTMVTSMDMLSAKRWMRIRRQASDVYKTKLSLDSNAVSGLRDLEKPYCIEINFRNVKDDEVRGKCYALPTSFHLKKKQISLIDKVIPELINQDSDIKRLKKHLGE